MEDRKPRIPRHVWFPVVFALVLAAGIVVGRYLGKPVIGPVRESGASYQKLREILGFIDKEYVDTVNRTVLTDDAIRALLEKLDPHSQYISTEEFAEMNDPLMGGFEGIGVQFNVMKDTILIVQVIPGGPSEKAGLLAGDRIICVDGDTMTGPGLKSKDVVRRLKGPKGTDVVVSVARKGVAGLRDFTLIRDVIPTYSIDVSYIATPGIGYIRLSRFSVTTAREFKESLTELLSMGATSLILDLRGNTGGYLEAAISLADEFLERDQLIVYTEGRSRPRRYSYATRQGNFENRPLVILLDEGSASASEILAGAIQDNDKGLIMGRRSFGKGLVQEQLQLPDGSAIRLTVARYYTPSGRSIQRPYENGREAYFHDFMDRMEKGELESADSIHFPDSLKYKTLAGRTVYGGGGITPDVFVGIQRDERLGYYNALVNSGILYQYCFDYTDRERERLRAYPTIEAFDQRYKLGSDVFQGLVNEASRQGITVSEDEMSFSRNKIEGLMKAYIARNLFNDAGFYKLFNQQDETFLKAVEILREGGDYPSLLRAAR